MNNSEPFVCFTDGEASYQPTVPIFPEQRGFPGLESFN